MKLTNDYFGLYYSNSRVIMDAENWDQSELFGLISEQMSSVYETTEDATIISENLEKHIPFQFNNDKKLSSQKCDSLFFDFLVGNTFIENHYQEDVLARSIIISSLKDFDLQVTFYPCGADYSSLKANPLYDADSSSLKFNPLYNINTIIELKK